jgi:hypothetical protein
MQTLSKGYKKPQNGDTFDKVFPALAADIQLMNDHVHDGVTGAVTPSKTIAFTPGGWVEDPALSGNYRQDKDLGANYPVDTTTVQFRKSTGEAIYPTMEKTSSTVIRVWVNDNTLTMNAVYG